MNLQQLGFDAHFLDLFTSFSSEGLIAARVARQDRDAYVVRAAGRTLRASVRGIMRHRAVSPSDFPAVGDWVAVQWHDGQGDAVIHAVLPRRSAITRKAAGDTRQEQIIAANVDTLLICCGLDGDYNPRRIERYLTLAYGSGASPAVLLTKADLCADVAAAVAEIETIAPGIPVIATTILDRAGVTVVRRLIPAGHTAALVGSSGTGKSTLINGLLGRDLMKTGAVREHDQRGRHTTTHRELLILPDGGVIIDTPGMRELQLWAGAADVDSAFSDIEELAAECRFRDCSHGTEPGCAVRGAIENGDLPAQRLASFHKQQRELRFVEAKSDPAAAAAHKAKWKVIHKAAVRHMKSKYRY